MNKKKMLDLIGKSRYSVGDIAKMLGLSKGDFLSKTESFDFLSKEMQLLTLVLGIKNPYNFFYNKG